MKFWKCVGKWKRVLTQGLNKQKEELQAAFDEGKSERMIRREGKYYFSPYVFTGISMFSFNPQAKHGDTWFELQPLGTEGQGTIAYPDKKKYSLTQLCIPFGTGIKYDLSKPNGTPRKVLDVSLAKKYGWTKKTELTKAIKYTYEDFIKKIKLN